MPQSNSLPEQLTKELLLLLPLYLKRSMRRRHGESGLLSPVQQQTLMVLIQRGEPLSMSRLAQFLGISRQQLTGLVDHLCEKGLAQRCTMPHNRRVTLVQVTEEGRRFAKEQIEKHAAGIARFFENLSEDEGEVLLKAFSILHRLFEADES